MSEPTTLVNLARLLLVDRPEDPAVQNFVFGVATALSEQGHDTLGRNLLVQVAETPRHLSRQIHDLLRDHPNAHVSAAAWARGESDLAEVCAMLDDDPTPLHVAAAFSYSEHLGAGRIAEMLEVRKGIVQSAALAAAASLPVGTVLGLLSRRPGEDLDPVVVSALRLPGVAERVVGDPQEFSFLHRLAAAASTSVNPDYIEEFLEPLESAGSLTKAVRRLLGEIATLHTEIPPELLGRIAALYCRRMPAAEELPDWVCEADAGDDGDAEQRIFALLTLLNGRRETHPVGQQRMLHLWAQADRSARDNLVGPLLASMAVCDELTDEVIAHVSSTLEDGESLTDRLLREEAAGFRTTGWVLDHPAVLLSAHLASGSTATQADWIRWADTMTPENFSTFVDLFLENLSDGPGGGRGVAWRLLDRVHPLSGSQLAKIPLSCLATRQLSNTERDDFADRLIAALPTLAPTDGPSATSPQAAVERARLLVAVADAALPAAAALAALDGVESL